MLVSCCNPNGYFNSAFQDNHIYMKDYFRKINLILRLQIINQLYQIKVKFMPRLRLKKSDLS